MSILLLMAAVCSFCYSWRQCVHLVTHGGSVSILLLMAAVCPSCYSWRQCIHLVTHGGSVHLVTHGGSVSMLLLMDSRALRCGYNRLGEARFAWRLTAIIRLRDVSSLCGNSQSCVVLCCCCVWGGGGGGGPEARQEGGHPCPHPSYQPKRGGREGRSWEDIRSILHTRVQQVLVELVVGWGMTTPGMPRHTHTAPTSHVPHSP